MEDDFRDKNVSLTALTDRIVSFFKEKGLDAEIRGKEGKLVVVAIPKPVHEIAEKIEVDVEGQPMDFAVKFIAGFHSRSLVRYGTFASLFGGGFLVPKGLKSLENIEKLEKDFWIFVDEAISFLSASG